MMSKNDKTSEYKNDSLRSKKIFSSFKKITSSTQSLIKFKSSFKKKCDQSTDIIFGKLQCIRLHEIDLTEHLFLQQKITILTMGDLSLVGLSDSNKVSYYYGILISTGMLMLYEYDKDDDQKLYFRIGINVRGAIVFLHNEVITIKSNLDILLKVSIREKLDNWYQKLCEASLSIAINSNSKESNSSPSIKLRRKTDGCIYHSVKNQLQYIKNSWKFSASMKEITTDSWNVDQSLIPSLLGNDYSQLSYPVVSDESFVIDSKFNITAIVLMRISSPGGSFFIQPFTRCLAILTQDILTLTTNKKSIKVMMKTCNLGIVQNLKWGIRIINEEYKIDFQLTSKTSYENWTLAFMKIFSFHSKSRNIDTVAASIIEHKSDKSPEFSSTKVSPLRRCHSSTRFFNTLSCKYKSVSSSYPSLRSAEKKINESIFTFQTIVDGNSKEPISIQESRLIPKRNSSCLDHPIPIPPNLNLSKSIINLNHSSYFEINTIYDEMETVYCDAELCSIGDGNSTPLPIRCKTHGIKKRLRNSYQQFARKLIKSELWKIEKNSNNKPIGVTSSQFRSENNLQYSDRFRKDNHRKGSKLGNKTPENKFDMTNMWNSVFDISDKKFDLFKSKYPNIYGRSIDEFDRENEYEEPLPSNSQKT